MVGMMCVGSIEAFVGIPLTTRVQRSNRSGARSCSQIRHANLVLVYPDFVVDMCVGGLDAFVGYEFLFTLWHTSEHL